MHDNDAGEVGTGIQRMIDDLFCDVPAWGRFFWPRWFAHDGVMLRPEVPAQVLAIGETVRLQQGKAKLPYLLFIRAPWFFWIVACRVGRSICPYCHCPA